MTDGERHHSDDGPDVASYAEEVTPPLDAGSEVGEKAREEADALERQHPRPEAGGDVNGAVGSD